MKYLLSVLVIVLLMSPIFFGCSTELPNGQQTEIPDNTSNGQSAEFSRNDSLIIPEFFFDIGKTLNVLKYEHPESEIIIKNDGFPNAAAAGFGEQEGTYSYLFFGGQDGDFTKAMNVLEGQLKCAGFLTTAGVLFPEMKEDMLFSDFFSLLDIIYYEYGADNDSAQGWLRFNYNNMDVWLNTNEYINGDLVINTEKVKRDAPVTISDREIFAQNQELVDAVRFE